MGCDMMCTYDIWCSYGVLEKQEGGRDIHKLT